MSSNVGKDGDVQCHRLVDCLSERLIDLPERS